MDNASKAWTARFLISLFPSVAAIAILSGYSFTEALGEGYSIILYLVVISAAEVIAVYAFQSEEKNAGDLLFNIFYLIVAVSIWAAFVFYRVGAALEPNTLALARLFVIGGVGVLPMFLVFRSHRKIVGGSKTLANLGKRRDEEAAELRESKPDEGRYGEEKIDVSS